MKTFLVPTDFSENAFSAYKYAQYLAGKMNAQVKLLHVCPIYIDALYPAVYADPLTQTEIDEANLLFKAYYDDGQSNVEISHLVQKGLVVETILQAADEVQADLIIMGTKGKDNLIEKFLGSNTLGVIERSSLPILVVPEKAHLEKIERVAYATNMEKEDEELIAQYIDIAQLLSAELDCVHVVTNPYSEKERKSFSQLEKVFAEEKGFGKVDFKKIDGPDILHSLNHYIAHDHIDLLVMLDRDRFFFSKLFVPSMTKKMATISRIPLLIHHKRKVS